MPKNIYNLSISHSVGTPIHPLELTNNRQQQQTRWNSIPMPTNTTAQTEDEPRKISTPAEVEYMLYVCVRMFVYICMYIYLKASCVSLQATLAPPAAVRGCTLSAQLSLLLACALPPHTSGRYIHMYAYMPQMTQQSVELSNYLWKHNLNPISKHFTYFSTL